MMVFSVTLVMQIFANKKGCQFLSSEILDFYRLPGRMKEWVTKTIQIKHILILSN